MAVPPPGLERIPSDELPAEKLKTIARITYVWPLDIAQHIRLSATRSTRAGAAKTFQGEIGFAAIGPLHGQFVADELNILWL